MLESIPAMHDAMGKLTVHCDLNDIKAWMLYWKFIKRRFEDAHYTSFHTAACIFQQYHNTYEVERFQAKCVAFTESTTSKYAR